MQRTMDYVPLDDVLPALVNPKGHAETEIAHSVSRFGFVEPIVRDERTGRLVSGHGRINELRRRRESGEPPPDGVEVDEQGRWLAPVVGGWSSRDDEEAQAYLLAANQLTIAGGWDNRDLSTVLSTLTETAEGLVGTGFVQDDLDRVLRSLGTVPVGDAGTYDPAVAFAILVECESESAQRVLLDRLIEEGLTCRAVMQ